jgi:hypothetical protein
MEGCCEHGSEHSGPLKLGELLDWLSYWKFLNKDSTSRCRLFSWLNVYDSKLTF